MRSIKNNCIRVGNTPKGLMLVIPDRNPLYQKLESAQPEFVHNDGKWLLRITPGKGISGSLVTRASGSVERVIKYSSSVVPRIKRVSHFGTTPFYHKGYDGEGRMLFDVPNHLFPVARKTRREAQPIPAPAPSPMRYNGTSEAIGLQEAVRAINEHKRQMGDNLQLSLTGEGLIRALMEIS